MMGSLLLLSSCSWYRNLERSLVADDEKQAQQRSKRPVSRDQYDQLVVKYEELNKKYEELKEGKPEPEKSSLVDELQNTQAENFSQGAAAAADTETVNLVTNEPLASTADVTKNLDAQLNLFRRGLSMKASNPGEATKVFQQLEAQGDPAVRVRAKLQVGELLFSKQQYDLALQVFEDIINKNAHSGAVLEALKYAVACSDKLGIKNKKEQYSSVLNDVFGAI
jgi:tetratricopeptide (TPR) repeat protein